MVIFTIVPDRPGALAGLLRVVADHGANVVEVTHLREGMDLHVRETAVKLVLQTRGREHGEAIVQAAARRGLLGAGRARGLELDRGHALGGIALAGHGARGGISSSASRCSALSSMSAASAFSSRYSHPLGAGNRGHVVALREQPGERDLDRRGAELLRQLADPLHALEVALAVVALEARQVAAEVAVGR